VAISSGGTAVMATDEPTVVPSAGVHTLCHADGSWLLMGATLSAGLALTWFAEAILRQAADGQTFNVEALVEEAARSPIGADGLLFLPYLQGERTPYLDAGARGVFLGLALSHQRQHLTRAILEGVAFALQDCLDALRAAGMQPTEIIASGGGSKSPVWRQILTDVLGLPLLQSSDDEHSSVGAAMTAARGLDVELPPLRDRYQSVRPNAEAVRFYERRHEVFRSAYRPTRQLVEALADAYHPT
jgi:xylulokinase